MPDHADPVGVMGLRCNLRSDDHGVVHVLELIIAMTIFLLVLSAFYTSLATEFPRLDTQKVSNRTRASQIASMLVEQPGEVKKAVVLMDEVTDPSLMQWSVDPVRLRDGDDGVPAAHGSYFFTPLGSRYANCSVAQGVGDTVLDIAILSLSIYLPEYSEETEILIDLQRNHSTGMSFTKEWIGVVFDAGETPTLRSKDGGYVPSASRSLVPVGRWVECRIDLREIGFQITDHLSGLGLRSSVPDPTLTVYVDRIEILPAVPFDQWNVYADEYESLDPGRGGWELLRRSLTMMGLAEAGTPNTLVLGKLRALTMYMDDPAGTAMNRTSIATKFLKLKPSESFYISLEPLSPIPPLIDFGRGPSDRWSYGFEDVGGLESTTAVRLVRLYVPALQQTVSFRFSFTLMW